MGNGRWDQPGVPHRGWLCVGVEDLADGAGGDGEACYAVCQMCGNERIRYVHDMEHPDSELQLRVGCVCAEKMSGDYVGPKRREAALRSRASRLSRWLTRRWRVSAKGNRFLNIKGLNLGVRQTPAGRWTYWMGKRFGRTTYPTMDEARLALFDDYWKSVNGT